jgi:serine/threonine protein kinase
MTKGGLFYWRPFKEKSRNKYGDALQLFPPGFLIADRYEVIQAPDFENGIRVGKMGFVYVCRDKQTGQLVALKFFKPQYLPDLNARTRFLDEGNAWIKLGSYSHIVHCYTVKYMDPTSFLVLELITNEHYPDNVSLYPWMNMPMPVDQALLFALQIARGMRYAVEKIPGLVHCDLKPANVLVSGDRLSGTDINRLCITDFGLSKIVAASGKEDTRDNSGRSNRNLGTPLYMAPEQWRNEPIGVYTDVYALGCILYDMLNGQSRRRDLNLNEIQDAHLSGKLRPVVRNLPGSVIDFLKLSLSAVAAERYQVWNKVTSALEEVYAGLNMGPVPQESKEDEGNPERFALASSYNAMGISYAHMGKPQEAVDYFKMALDIFQEIRHQQGEGTALGNLGNTYAHIGKVDEALRYCKRDLAITRKRGDRIRESLALGNIGEIYRNQGDVQNALEFYEKKLDIVRTIGDLRGEGNALSSLGMAYVALGDFDKALGCYKRQLVITRKIGDRRGRANAWGNLGNAYAQRGETTRAISFYNLCLKVAREIGDRAGEGSALGNLGNVYMTLGDIQNAINLFYKPRLDIAREIRDKRGESNVLGNLGIAYARLSRLDDALDYYQMRLKIAQRIGDIEGLSSTLFNMGHLYMQKRQVPDAIRIWVNLYVFAKQMKLDQALQRLAQLAPKVGLPEGLEGWENLLQSMQEQGTMKDFTKDLMKN